MAGKPASMAIAPARTRRFMVVLLNRSYLPPRLRNPNMRWGSGPNLTWQGRLFLRRELGQAGDDAAGATHAEVQVQRPADLAAGAALAKHDRVRRHRAR